MGWFWRRRDAGRHGLGAAVTSIPSGPLVVPVSMPVPAVDPEVAAALARAQAEAALLPALPLDEVARVLGVDLPVAVDDAEAAGPAPEPPLAVDPEPVPSVPALPSSDPPPVVSSVPPAAPAAVVPSTAVPTPPRALSVGVPSTTAATPPALPASALPSTAVPTPPNTPAAVMPSAPAPAPPRPVGPAFEPSFVQTSALPFVPEQAEPAPRVQLGFRDGSTSGVDDVDQARALEELARALTSSG